MGRPIEIRSDCSRCAALCCIAYPSQDMPGFAAAKAAGEACPKLDGSAKCTIYDRRAEEGFSGCIRYECFGAGQHVVQTLFGGVDWRENPSLLEPMLAAFLAMRPISDLLYLVTRAEQLRPSDSARQELAAMRRDLVELAASVAGLSNHARIERQRTTLARIYASLDRDLVEKT